MLLTGLLVGLVTAVVIMGVLLIRSALYRSSHPYTTEDFLGARTGSGRKSCSITLGKTQEQLAPLFPEFLSQFNPNDARFLGSPLDFVVFDGLCEDDFEIRQVVFVEVKTGKSRISPRERRVREAILAGRVSYQIIHVPGSVEIVVDPGLIDMSDASAAAHV